LPEEFFDQALEARRQKQLQGGPIACDGGVGPAVKANRSREGYNSLPGGLVLHCSLLCLSLLIHPNCRTSARWPVTAAAAAIAGDTRCVRPFCPCRPSKFRFDVLAQR